MKTLFLSLLVFVSCSAIAQQNTFPMVTVAGEGELVVVPDEVTITLGVETIGKDPETVKTENDNAIDAVIRYTQKMNISRNNVQTQYVNLNRNVDYQTKDTSYVANQSLSIKIEDLDRYDKIITGLMEQGVNTIQNVQFSSSKMEEYEQKARTKAIQNAKAKAEQYVTALGESLGTVVNITEAGASTPQPRPMMESVNMMKTASARESIAPGEMTIKEHVEVSFYIKSASKG